ncbi:MAG: DNA mismatch repair endonuclease MutL [Anaerolineae bacterium]
MPIRLLPEEIASRIAAGEVVERPASVVKELVENSLDAHADRIEVETRDGGKSLIRVQDNGAGIAAAEVEIAFRRHATSKLENVEDLHRVATLGFRGEALASIASVSRITCTTRYTDETVGTRLRLEGGKIVHRGTTGRPPGTEMTIQDLFYNTPARRKFLHTDRTERRHIDGFLTRYAIAYPGVAFQVMHDGRETLRTPGNDDAREALLAVYGMDLGSNLLTIPTELTAEQPIKVGGFVGPTTVHRANRGYITLIINGRWVQDLRITYAIIQAYHTLLPTKRYPVAFVTVDLPPEEVDVNVHPAKTEVRFRDGDQVFRAVQRAVRATVVSEAPATAAWEPPRSSTSDATQTTRARLAGLKPATGQQFSFSQATGEQTSDSQGGGNAATDGTTTKGLDVRTTKSGATFESRLPPLRIVGQVATTFIVTEGPDGLYLIDQHAAHERVLYEQLLSHWSEGSIPSQPLLEPVTVTLPADEADRLEELLPTLSNLGLEVEVFGPGTFIVRALPAHLNGTAPQDLLADIASSEIGDSPIREDLEERMVRHICKRAAVKAGQVLSREEMEGLVHDLEKALNPRTCPHGRPTILQISLAQLTSQFERR